MNNNNSPDYLRAEEGTNLKDYINLIRVNLIPFIFISLAGLAVAIIYALNARDIYKSTTVIKLYKPTGNILEAPLLPEFQDFGSDRFIANEIEILKSYTLREKVAEALVDSFNTIKQEDSFFLILDRESNFNNNAQTQLKSVFAITKMLESVKIDQKRGLDIVEISVESPSPFEAALIANCYANAYKYLNLNYNRQQLIAVKQFLDEQRVEKMDDLRESEDRLKEYQERGGIVALPNQAQALIQQLTDFESKQKAVKIELTISENNLSELKKELKKQDPTIDAYLENLAKQSYIKSLQEQIAKFQVQRESAVTNNPEAKKKDDLVKEFDSKINELKKKLEAEINKTKAGLFASTPEEIKLLTQKVFEEEVKYQALSASYSELNKIVAGFEKKFNQLPNRTIDLARLQREQSAFEKLYLLVEEKYQEALINEQSTPGNVLIVDDARIPVEPSKPNRILIVLVGLVLGLGMGAGFAFIRNYFDSTIKTPEDIQNKNINVLAWIPQIEGAALDKDFEFIVHKKPNSIPSEAFRALRTRIQFSKIDVEQLKTILITSATPQEGKTTVSTNLAGSFANAGKRTLIIDCDLRKPRLHNILGTKRYPGFVDHFFGQASYDEILRTSEVQNLFFITGGTIPPNPSEILGSSQMEQFLQKLRNEFDIIILDSPPVVAVTDSEILSGLTDGTVLVTSANITEVDLMKKAVELLTHERGSFLGCVLNNFTYRSGYGSYYKYYYYYSKPTEAKVKK